MSRAGRGGGRNWPLSSTSKERSLGFPTNSGPEMAAKSPGHPSQQMQLCKASANHPREKTQRGQGRPGGGGGGIGAEDRFNCRTPSLRATHLGICFPVAPTSFQHPVRQLLPHPRHVESVAQSGMPHCAQQICGPPSVWKTLFWALEISEEQTVSGHGRCKTV